jgi:hypothetical protein
MHLFHSTHKIQINFDLWNLKIEYLLVDREQWTIVCLGTMPIVMSMEEWEILERRLMSTI